MKHGKLLIGIDIGGTFTDAIVIDSDTRQVLMAFKTPSTPREPAAAVLMALDRIAERFDVKAALVCHGTTIGTNALIERAGARAGLLATKGFADVIELRRQDRPTLYDLAVEISEPLIDSENRFEVDERIGASGEVIDPLKDTEQLMARIEASGVTSVAISLLNSYVNPVHERVLKDQLQARLPGLFITVSSEICPEYGEYERTSTAVVNSYIGPAVRDYVLELSTKIRRYEVDRVLIVKSNGGLTSAENAMQFPAHLIESGPAAGMIATASYATNINRANTIAFDMGGTTAKAGVITEFTPKMTSEFRADALKHGRNVGGYPIRGSVLDIVEIGSGGGSISWIDAGGVPKVGPESAGADPGPACYSRGGVRPTVTDAHAVIGTICENTFEGTGVRFSRELAIEAINEHIAKPMGWPVEKAAYAIISIAVASMTEMVKLATVRRGLDPRDFSLVASGGAGPLHAALVGKEIGVVETIVPPYSGMFSALGATLGNVKHNISQTILVPLQQLTVEMLVGAFRSLAQRGDDILGGEAVGESDVMIERYANCRYIGQLYELEVGLGNSATDLPDAQALENSFRDAYRVEFGIELPLAKVELVKTHITVTLQPKNKPNVFQESVHNARQIVPARSQRYVKEDGSVGDIPVYSTHSATGLDATGPMIIEHAGSTVWVRDNDRAKIHSDGCVIVTHAR